MTKLQIIENALNWQAEGKWRTVTVKSGDVHGSDFFSVFCYDYNLGHGEHVDDGRVIDLDKSYRAANEAMYNKLKPLHEVANEPV